jgi:hypothetical protein
MPLLRMRNASFANAAVSAGPVTLEISPGQRAALGFSTPREASVVALMAAGIVKASTGCVLVADYDPRVQSVHCKRIAGFVPHEPLHLGEGDFFRYVGYRAALWSLDAQAARAYARVLRERLDGVHEAFAFPLIGALIARPQLLVLDRPQRAYVRQILNAIDGTALLSTHAHAGDAEAFADSCETAAAR